MARIEAFDSARFTDAPPPARPKAGAQLRQREEGEEATADEPIRKPDDVRRAVRRVRQKVYDLIQCNPELDAFVTFTYSPEVVGDKGDYAECYPYLKNWLSNAVQRRGLRYICVPELTKIGDVHFHAICNFDALSVCEAVSPHTGRVIRHRGDIVYNLTDWHAGFTTCQRIRRRTEGDDTTTAVARYMWKYMGKNMGAKIGGRYALTGGQLAKPVNAFGVYPEEFTEGDLPEPYRVEIERVGVYKKYEF